MYLSFWFQSIFWFCGIPIIQENLFFLFNVRLKTEVRKTSTLSLSLLIKQKKEHGDGFHNVNATVS